MTELTEEKAIMLIVYGGNARSHALKAIDLASQGELVEARRLMIEANHSLKSAGLIQKKYIENSFTPTKTEYSSMNIIEIHAQDHYMNALTVVDLAGKFIDLYATKKE